MNSICLSLVLWALSLSWIGEEPEVIKADALAKRFTNDSDTTYVINLWATWCAPCVKELPYFEQLNETYKDKKVKVLLVSIDFVADYEKKLVPFVKKRKLQSEVMLLNETKPNEFIDKIHPKWSGSIPATLIVNSKKGYKEFFEEEVTYEFLEKTIQSIEK
jgi:thiol-disulfide isomerase/thioredoxin